MIIATGSQKWTVLSYKKANKLNMNPDEMEEL